MHVLTFGNNLHISRNLCMLFIFEIEWIVGKMACMGLTVLRQKQPKISDTIRLMWRKKLKRTSTHCTKCNEINLCYIDTKACFQWKRFKYYVIFAYRITQKASQLLRRAEIKKLKSIFANLYCTMRNEINIFLRFRIACFTYRIEQKISNILWVMLRNAWKCIFSSVP